MGKKYFLWSILLIGYSSLLSMGEFDFLLTLTSKDLDEKRRKVYISAAHDNSKQFMPIFDDYLQTIDLEKSLQEITIPHNKEPQTTYVKRLISHLRSSIYPTLYNAIAVGNYKIAKLLLIRSPTLNLKNDPGNFLHMICTGKWHENEIKTREIIDLLLKAKIDINRKRESKTALDIADGTEQYGDKFSAPVSIQEFLKKKGAKRASEL
jgi:hypothetical protein